MRRISIKALLIASVLAFGLASPVRVNAQEYTATHYGESYNNSNLGCANSGVYHSSDPTIAAVGPSDYNRWPCGTVLEVSGPAGTIQVTRRDACPGCVNMIDLSEAAHILVCGGLGSCQVFVTSQ